MGRPTLHNTHSIGRHYWLVQAAPEIQGIGTWLETFPPYSVVIIARCWAKKIYTQYSLTINNSNQMALRATVARNQLLYRIARVRLYTTTQAGRMLKEQTRDTYVAFILCSSRLLQLSRSRFSADLEKSLQMAREVLGARETRRLFLEQGRPCYSH